MVGIADSLKISAAGMRAQGERLKVVAENMANSDSTAATPGEAPYRRKIILFQNVLDKEMGVQSVKIGKRSYDNSPFQKKYDPTHPAADADGYIQLPNVNPIVEMMDMREARRGYEANLNVVEVAKSMLTQTIGLLK